MWKLALRNLFSRKMRSSLSLLGMTVAIVGMVGLFSVSEGLDRMVNSTIDRIPGLVAMQPGAPIPLFSRIPADWVTEIEEFPEVSVVTPEIWQRVNVIDNRMIVNPPRFLFGTEIPSRLKLTRTVYQQDMKEGRFLTLEDQGTYNTVVSRQIAEEFEKSVGDELTVNGTPLTIVGIYDCGSLLLDVAIILDINIVREITRFDQNSVSAFYIEQDLKIDEEELAKRIQEHFRGRDLEPWRSSSLEENLMMSQILTRIPIFGKLIMAAQNAASQPPKTPTRNPTPQPSLKTPAGGYGEVDTSVPLEVRSAMQWASRFDKVSENLDVFLLLITGIGVTVAVLSIVNTMLMSVTERIIEFGILKANGWSKMDVLKLITSESALLGIGGGILGCVFGWAGTHAVNAAFPTRVELFASPQLLVFSLAFSTCMGILGGLYPAIWAMRMMPMDAIRRG